VFSEEKALARAGAVARYLKQFQTKRKTIEWRSAPDSEASMQGGSRLADLGFDKKGGFGKKVRHSAIQANQVAGRWKNTRRVTGNP
jgi:hypothetical protein